MAETVQRALSAACLKRSVLLEESAKAIAQSIVGIGFHA